MKHNKPIQPTLKDGAADGRRCYKPMQVEIDFGRIKDWDSFHASFKNAMGFPDFYGSNNDAWIDCMSYIDDPDAGMSTMTVTPGEALDILVRGTIDNCINNVLSLRQEVSHATCRKPRRTATTARARHRTA